MDSFTKKLQYFLVSVPSEFVAHVQINRPTKRNAFSTPVWFELKAIFKHISNDKDIRAVVLSGIGRSFSAGIDFGDPDVQKMLNNEGNYETARQAVRLNKWITGIQECIGSVEKCAKPVICVIHSHTYGLALDLVCNTDIRICAEDTSFAAKEVDMGIIADLGSLQLLPKIVGNQSWVKEVCLTGRTFEAQEARLQGLVSRVYKTKEQALDEGLRIAVSMARKSPVAVQGTKMALGHARDHSLEEGLRFGSNLNCVALQATDVQEALLAGQKRKIPTFEKL